jgi:hypothetical protein
MSWLKFDVSTPEKPEVMAITIALGYEDPDLTVGKLLKVWRWFDSHTQEGNAVGVTPALLNKVVAIPGICEAMADVGWIVVSSSGVSLPNFDRHNGKTAKDRALGAKRAASHKSNAKGNEESNAPSVTSALPREEKRREEEISKLSLASPRPLAEAEPEPNKPRTGKPSLPDCPHLEILALWAEVLPALPQHLAAEWRGTRADHLRARWREKAVEKQWTTQADGLEYFRRLFAHIGKSSFLTGKTPNRDPTKRQFVIELEWLVSPGNWAKVLEGKYNEEAVAA